MRTKSMLTILAVLLLLPLTAIAGEAFDYTYFDVAYVNNGLDSTATSINDRERVDLDIGDGDGIGIRASLALHQNFHVFANYTGSNMDLNATQTVPFPTLDNMRAAFLSSPGTEYWDELCDLTGDGIVNFADLAKLKEAYVTGNDTRVASFAAVGGDMTDWRVGVGYNRLLTPKVSGYAQMFWDARDLDFDKAAFMGETRDFGANDNGIGATVGLRGRVTDQFEMTGRVSYSPVNDIDLLAGTGDDMFRDDTLYGIGGKYSFTDTFSVYAEVEGDGDTRAWLFAARYETGS